MIQYEKIDIAKASEYRALLQHASHRGCGFSFANIYMWGRQYAAQIDGYLSLFSHFFGHTVYPYPIGDGDVKPVLEAIIADAKERGIPCRLSGMSMKEKQELETLFPGQFCYHCDRDSFDYVYDINDLADLKGRAYQQKRNHVNKFTAIYPDFRIVPLSQVSMHECRDLADQWYKKRSLDNPDEDLLLERNALNRAICHFEELQMEGLMLYVGDTPVAMTMASFLSHEEMDVHFEKALAEYPGAYAVINREFARYVREKYPQVKYLNREDDLGSEGLRKAKLSYHPHHMVEKCWAHLKVEGYDD